MDAGLNKKNILVTGGSGGIGQAIVRQLSAEGANTIVHYHSGKDRADKIVESLTAGKNIEIAAELTSESEVKSLFNQAEAALGTIDILVANAGKWPVEDVPIHQMTLERWNHTFAVNSTSVFLCVREYLQRCIDRNIDDPAIVITGSTAGNVGEAGHGDYASAKSSLMYGMVQSLKNEVTRVAPRGRANAVCPGWTMTPMARSLTSDENGMKRALQTIPLRKFASSDDIANAVVFLASNKLAGHITGQTLFVDGGMEGRVINAVDEIDLKTAVPQYPDDKS